MARIIRSVLALTLLILGTGEFGVSLGGQIILAAEITENVPDAAAQAAPSATPLSAESAPTGRAPASTAPINIAWHGDPALDGQAIFEAYDALDSGYIDLRVNLQMILRTAKGRENQRALRISQLEVPEDSDKVLVVFDAPANIRGTALLSHGHLDRDDDQWLYLPAIARTKKIASRNKSGPFVGSEFSFEDLSPPDISKYSYQFIEEAEEQGLATYVVDRVPLDQYSGYSRQRVWLDQQHLRILRIDYFNRRDQLYKRLQARDFVLYAGRFWRATFMRMDNLKTGKSTDLRWGEFAFGVGLSDQRDFSVASLRRAR